MRLSDLLRSLDVGLLASDLRKLFSRVDDNFQVLKRALSNQITLSDNVQCDIVTTRFDSGTPTQVSLRHLKNARSGILLGSAVPAFCAPIVTSSGRGAAVTLYFAQNAKSVLATVALFDEGTPAEPGSLLATANAVGLTKSLAVDPVAGHVLTSDGTAWVGAAPSTGSTAPWSLATKPVTPDARDEEFEGTAFAGWMDLNTRIATAISPLDTFATANSFRDSWNIIRPSWYMVQASTDGNQAGIYKPITLETNDFVYARVVMQNNAQSNYAVSLMLADNVLTYANYVRVNLILGYTSGDLIVANSNLGTTSSLDTPNQFYNGFSVYMSPPFIEYLAIMKRGTTFYFWAASAAGQWGYLGSVVNAGVTGAMNVVLRSYGGPGALPGNAITGYDFVRFRANSVDLP